VDRPFGKVTDGGCDTHRPSLWLTIVIAAVRPLPPSRGGGRLALTPGEPGPPRPVREATGLSCKALLSGLSPSPPLPYGASR
jgi:hypothetical protein